MCHCVCVFVSLWRPYAVEWLCLMSLLFNMITLMNNSTTTTRNEGCCGPTWPYHLLSSEGLLIRALLSTADESPRRSSNLSLLWLQPWGFFQPATTRFPMSNQHQLETAVREPSQLRPHALNTTAFPIDLTSVCLGSFRWSQDMFIVWHTAMDFTRFVTGHCTLRRVLQ